MAAIDMHAHAFPDAIAARAMAKLQASAPQCPARGDGTIKGLLASMDQADIDVSVVCAIATRPGQAEGILKWCRKIRSGRIEPLASVHPGDADAAKWVERIAEAGLAGIKLHPMYQDCAADDPRMDPIYAAAEKECLLVESHCGLDLSYPPDYDLASPARFARVMEKFPALRLLCTHMGGWRCWDQVETLILGGSAALETSFSLDELGPQRSLDMIRRHGVDKVHFGSDWPWKDQSEAIKLVEGLGLSEKESRAVLYANSAVLLGY
jgi:predicted TIM-barrel fold metal-dependent hydrolase